MHSHKSFPPFPPSGQFMCHSSGHFICYQQRQILRLCRSADPPTFCGSMRIDNLQSYVNLRRELTQEREQLSRRLRQINEALGRQSATDARAALTLPSVVASAVTAKPIKRSMSPAARARIAEAQRLRWAASRKDQPKAATPAAGSGKRTFSPAARRAIAEAARRLWAAAKRAGKNRL